MKINVKIHFRDLFERDNPRAIRAFTTGFGIGVVAAGAAFQSLRAHGVLLALLGGVAAFVVVFAGVPLLVLSAADAGARGFTSFVAPSGSGTPSEDDYSREKAMLVRGQVDAALASIQRRLGASPDDVALLLFAADVYVRNADDPAQAERLYRRAREMRGVKPAQDYLATNRLIDLYMGQLDDPARAREELERIRARHAGTTAAAHAEQALRQLDEGGR
jgi:hypothetical protein